MTDGQEIIQRLRENEALRREGLSLLVQTLMELRVSDLVDPADAAGLVVAAMSATGVQRVVDEHWMQFWDRHRARVDAKGESVGDMLPAETRETMEKVFIALDPKAPEWTREVVDKELLRQLIAPVFQQTLMSFASRLPLMNLGGGIADKLRRRVAQQTEEVRKGALGRLSDKVEEGLQASAKEFSANANREFSEALRERLASEEGQGLATEIRRRAFARIMEVKTVEAMDLVDELPRDELVPLVGAIIAHNTRRPFGREVVRAEVEAALAIEGEKTLGELLTEHGLFDALTQSLHDRGDVVIRALLERPGLKDWLDSLLKGPA